MKVATQKQRKTGRQNNTKNGKKQVIFGLTKSKKKKMQQTDYKLSDMQKRLYYPNGRL
jgi:hypothetical protein